MSILGPTILALAVVNGAILYDRFNNREETSQELDPLYQRANPELLEQISPRDDNTEGSSSLLTRVFNENSD